MSINNQEAQLSLLVVEGDGPSLLGFDWLKTIKLDWAHLHQVCSTTELQQILNDDTSLFSDELGCVKGTQAKICIDSTATPKFCRAKTVPCALREKVEREINTREREGVITPARFSEWVAPVVPVVKNDASIHICEDTR